MIYIFCYLEHNGDRVPVKLCAEKCPRNYKCEEYATFLKKRDMFVALFSKPEACPFCHGVGVYPNEYVCPVCLTKAPWRF